MSSDEFLFGGVAAELGHTIAQSAIWFDGRCNWIGALPRNESQEPVAIAALGADLYGGTSGVALFLAQAGTKLDDDRLRTTAVGAISHALDHANRVNPALRDGFYLGPIGVAYAAAHVAGLLDRGDVMARARELLSEWRGDGKRSPAADVMGGCAGALAGLVALTESVAEPWLLEAAVSLGDELIARAVVTPAGWSWAVPGRRWMHNLCGFAHGTAGIGYALAELFGVTGDARFRDAAERALDHERSWFDSQSGAWPDLRDVARTAGRDAPMPTADSWCNGAAGIALSRRRAAELLGTAAVQGDADSALVACERHASELLAHAPADFSLCHGAAGTGDVLLSASEDRAGSHAELAAGIGRLGVESHHRSGKKSFSFGVPEGNTPGLFLGLAGVATFYLRLLDPRLPSPLLVHRSPA